MAALEGKLIELAVMPGELVNIGITLLTASGEQEGRYMRPPEHTYGSIKINGEAVYKLDALIKFIMEATRGVQVKWMDEVFVEFTTCPEES